MTDVQFTPKAQQDLNEIWDHTFDQWGVNRADTYVRRSFVRVKTYRRDAYSAVARNSSGPDISCTGLVHT